METNTNFYTERISPAQILPARFHFRQAVPSHPPETPPTKNEKAAARAAHDFHVKTWGWFSESLRKLVEPFPALNQGIRALLKETNEKFQAPLQEVGWKPCKT